MADAARDGGALRVVLLSTFYPPESFGGDGVAVRRLADGLRARGHDVRVLHNPSAYRLTGGRARDDPRDADATALPDGPGAGLITTGTYLTGRPVGYARRLRSLTGSADVVHLHNPSLLGGPAAFGAGGPGAVRLYTTHEHWLLCPMHVLFRNGREVCTRRTCVRCSLAHRRPPQPWRATGLLETSLRQVDVVLCPSSFTRDLHQRAFPDADVRVHPQPGPDAADVAAATAAPAPGRTRPYVVVAARLEPVKGVLPLVEAWRRVRDVDLLVAGDGSQRALVERAASGARVEVLGALGRPDLLALVRHARAVAVPSVGLETFGGAAVEAMSLGTPVVVRALGPLPELVAHGAGLAATDDEGLVAALRRLSNDRQLRAACSAKALQAARTTYAEQGYFGTWFRTVAEAAARRDLHDVADRAAQAAALEGEQ